MAYDLVIKNGMLIDGSGLPRYRAARAARARDRGDGRERRGPAPRRQAHGALPGQLLRGPLARQR